MPLLRRRQLPALIAALIGGGSVGVRAEPASDQLTISAAEGFQWEIDHYVNVSTHLANPPRPLEVWVRAPAPKFQLAQSVSDSLRRLPKGI